jgi:hypothetical protein
MAGRIWTEEENELLRAEYRRRGAKWVARRVGRSVQAVYLHAIAIGVGQHRVPTTKIREFVASQHAAGLLDTEIAAAWAAVHPDRPLTRRDVCYHRRTLGLPVQAERRLERRRDGYRTQCERLGVDGVQDLWKRHLRRNATRLGWPANTTPREIAILEVMRDGKYRTRAEIAEAIGEKATSQRWWFKSRQLGGSALCSLIHRGLLRRSRGRTRRVAGKGKGCSQFEYWMPMEVLHKISARKLA